MKLDDQVHILGIRHHGPGCAHALNSALNELQPDAILLEGAQELEQSWSIAAHADIQPPVAQLIYDPKDAQHSVFYPWAEFSPEWQAMRYASANNIALHMMDLPAGIEFELQAQEQAAAEQEEQEDEASVQDMTTEQESPDQEITAEQFMDLITTPLDKVVKAAGYDDGEAWWDITVEHQRGGLDTFAAIADIMKTARTEQDESASSLQSASGYAPREQLREAWMRKILRQARKNYQKIVVVCGAWHVPALAQKVAVKDDNARLKGLKKRTVTVAWVPFTYQRFSLQAGYRAGIDSPGWYEHLYRHHVTQSNSEELTIHWLIRIAQLLREQGFGCSSAHVIEAVRLATSLAELRQLKRPSLQETLEATQAVMTEGQRAPLLEIQQQLIISNRIGQLPADIPQLPIEQDLNAQIKKLRLKKQADPAPLKLDLRKDISLQRSQLFHRLRLLNMPWGQLEESRGLGTFKEQWLLQWQPEFAVALIDASVLGNTIASAASQRMIDDLTQFATVKELADAIDQIYLCHLPAAIQPAVKRLKNVAGVSADVQDLMLALLKLTQILRYGSVRALAAAELEEILDSMIIRISNGLNAACASLDETAAYTMLAAVDQAHSAINVLENPDQQQRWLHALLATIENDAAHPVLAGRMTRILYELKQLDKDQLAQRFQLNLSQGSDPILAAAWLEGLLFNGAVVLLFDDDLFGLLDDWLNQLPEPDFVRVLPLLRRTFTTFSSVELRQIADRVLHGSGNKTQLEYDHDPELATAALEALARLLGLKVTQDGH